LITFFVNKTQVFLIVQFFGHVTLKERQLERILSLSKEILVKGAKKRKKNKKR
jgi:hypothetical protein